LGVSLISESVWRQPVRRAVGKVADAPDTGFATRGIYTAGSME